MISIILPVYHVEKYIDACISSLLRQTLQDFELIIVNDGSTDRSGEKCLAWSKKDSRIRVVEQENQGLSEARNSGLRIARGEYITFVDSDDTVDENYLKTLYDNMIQNEAQVSVCNYQLVWETEEACGKAYSLNKDSSIDEVTVYTGREAAAQIVKENKRFMITAWGKLYHKSLVPYLYYPKGRIHEDEFVTYKVFYYADKVAVTMQPLYFYLQRGSSMMGTDYHLKRLDKVFALQEAIHFFEEAKDTEMCIYAKKRYLLNIQIAWYRVHKYLPNEKQVLLELREKWKTQRKEWKKELFGYCSFLDRVALGVFAISPPIYGCVAGMYVKLWNP